MNDGQSSQCGSVRNPTVLSLTRERRSDTGDADDVFPETREALRPAVLIFYAYRQ